MSVYLTFLSFTMTYGFRLKKCFFLHSLGCLNFVFILDNLFFAVFFFFSISPNAICLCHSLTRNFLSDPCGWTDKVQTIHLVHAYASSLLSGISFFFFFYFYFLTLQYCIGFAIYQHESTTGIHVFPILNPPPSSLPIPPLWVIQCTSPKHPVSSIESGLATCFIYDIIPTPLSRRPYLTGLPPSMPLSTLKAEAKPFLSITLHGPGLATECELHKYS